ncbi:hypothetical protein NDU88_000426 [Pleurodeles waltl]|uniref:Uncharacterized protein n=1 Tax=Pleurodeles waltl TaxID=8319 RepID=A0AAV7VWV2_PLEWA|nr:hypothetical protein NDU88_000426 [Pleurodeles waltl]
MAGPSPSPRPHSYAPAALAAGVEQALAVLGGTPRQRGAGWRLHTPSPAAVIAQPGSGRGERRGGRPRTTFASLGQEEGAAQVSSRRNFSGKFAGRAPTARDPRLQ